ncbi:MAG: DNA-protecting protein DprA [Actinomycetota bacterium]|nr:DNA-protecting protein DprA [Actinomycetota bacterium]
MTWDEEQRAALIALLRTRTDGARGQVICERVAQTLDALGLLRETDDGTLFGSSIAEQALAVARRDVATWRSGPFRMLTFLDREYPERLRSVRNMPPVIFVQGQLLARDRGVCVVGSRKPSERGVAYAAAVARLLVEAGITVIAGLAQGVDTAAHRAALLARGRTVAVLGCGLEYVYPASNSELGRQICREGLVLSQFMPSLPPTPSSFPLRNATMSAYGYATIVVEAGEYSGTRIQAREGVAHGRPVILDNSVVVGTRWGRDLLSRPGIHVATSPRHAVAHVLTVLRLEDQIDRILTLA